MGISGISAVGGYQVLGVYGNPGSMAPVQKISNEGQRKNPLVSVAEEKLQKAVPETKLPQTTSTEVNSFADIMNTKMQDEKMVSRQKEVTEQWNDTIGLMGFQNKLREELTGESFQSFEVA